jgi:heptosyltransferase III
LDYKNILIFRTGFLGDTLVSLPAFWAVRNAFPNARLTLLSNSSEANSRYVLAQSILPKEGLFDNWITYPGGQSKTKLIQSFTKLFLEIRRGKFDALIYLMSRNRSKKSIERDKLFFRFAGIKNIIGTEYLLNNLLSYNQARPLPKVESEVDFFLNCLKPDIFSVNNSKPKPEMLLNVDEIQTADKWLEDNCNFNGKKKLIAVAPGSKWESKIWSEERYFQVIKKLTEEKNIFPIVFGGQEDRETGERLIKKLGSGANAAGKLNIRQAASALAKCELYLGNDTGTMHLAASVGTVCVGLFAAIDFDGRWYPSGENHHIIRKKVECEGCHSPVSLNNNKCLELIEVDEVYQTCVKVLG